MSIFIREMKMPLTIRAFTVPDANGDYNIYINNDSDSGDEFIVSGVEDDKYGIFYTFGNSQQTEYYAPADIPAFDIYLYSCTLPTQTIWTNNITTPSILYTVTTYIEEGEEKTIVENYTGNDWRILGVGGRSKIFYINQESYRDSSKRCCTEPARRGSLPAHSGRSGGRNRSGWSRPWAGILRP